MKTGTGRYTALIVELVCCLLGSCAFCSVLLPALGQEVTMSDCAAFAAVGLSVIFLLSRRWWLTPAVLAFLALAGLGILYFFRLREPLEEYVRGFLDWYNAACPYQLPYSENGSLFLVHLAFSFPVTLVLYLYFRRFSFLPLWVLLSGGLLVWMYLSGTEGMLTVAALLLIVLFVLIARTNSRSCSRKLGAKEKIPAAAMQVTALALAPLVVLFAFAIGPKEEGVWQSKGLVHFLEDLRDVFSFYSSEGGSGSGGSFDLSYSGLAPNGFTLGGDIEPNNKAVLRVKTDTPILLAGAVYDTYDGRGWYDGWGLGRFRFSSPLWRGKRREVYNIDKPASHQTSVPYGKVSKSAILEISLSVRFRSLFAGGKLERLTLLHGDDSTLYFNTQGELFTLEYPPTGTSYIIRTRIFDRSTDSFDWNMLLLQKYASAGKDPEFEDILLRYTGVSDTVEQEVRDLTAEIVKDCETPYEQARAIEEWLGENCTYTKTPGDVPEGRDFVSWFLETKEGYCTYYASAMTVMARIAGLPARYVTGYGLKQADRRTDTNSYVATNATAHAWAQVYLYGIGWVDFDPLFWNSYELVETDPPVEREPVKPTPTPVVELPEPELPEPELPEEPEKTAPAPKRRSDTGKILLIILCADVAAFLIFLLVRFILLFFRVESYYYRLARKYRNNAARADECYRQILRQLGFLGLTLEPSDTIASFCARADAALPPDRGAVSLSSVCEPVILSRFAGRTPTDGEVRRLCDYYIATERRLRRTLGVRRYILRRMILGK